MFIITNSEDTLRWVKIKSNDLDNWQIHRVEIGGEPHWLIEIDKRLADGWKNILTQYGCTNFDFIPGVRGWSIINQGGV